MLQQANGDRVDTRTPITMWNLLIWAYKRQMVHYEYVGRERGWETGFRSTSSTWRFGAALAYGGYARGSINGAGTTAHEDAHIVHSHVMALEPTDRDLIIRTAERGTPPNPNPVLPSCRIMPVRKGGTGKIKMLYGRSGRPIACLIEYQGISANEAKKIRINARKANVRWQRLVYNLYALSKASVLARWKIVSVGTDHQAWQRAC